MITPRKVIIKEACDGRDNPIIIPLAPVPKNKSIKTFSLCGLMYFIDVALDYRLLKIDGICVKITKEWHLLGEHFKPS